MMMMEASAGIKRRREDDTDKNVRCRKLAKEDMDAIYDRTLKKLLRGSIHFSSDTSDCMDTENQCQSCDEELGSVVCSFCSNHMCDMCTQQCDLCQDVFCSLCSSKNFDERHDRVFCLDCYANYNQRRSMEDRSSPLKKSSLTTSGYSQQFSLHLSYAGFA
mmetsp:Transcript_26763/g.74812  ORF Transcript_26763/g.74812 Transcript_26763/m.74812 type:complete len:161 (+) Transcript_26763:135-617(+)